MNIIHLECFNYKIHIIIDYIRLIIDYINWSHTCLVIFHIYISEHGKKFEKCPWSKTVCLTTSTLDHWSMEESQHFIDLIVALFPRHNMIPSWSRSHEFPYLSIKLQGDAPQSITLEPKITSSPPYRRTLTSSFNKPERHQMALYIMITFIYFLANQTWFAYQIKRT